MFIGKELTPQQRLSKCVMDIMCHDRYRALQPMMMVGSRSVRELPFPTAMTDGRNEWYDPRFIAEQNDAQLRFAILHECQGHKMFRHLQVYRNLYDRDPRISNQATDHWINLMLMDEDAASQTPGFIKPPTLNGKHFVCMDARFRGMSIVQIFNILLQENPTPPGGRGNPAAGAGGAGGDGVSSPGEDGTFDYHDWDAAKDMTQEEAEGLAREIEEAARQGSIIASKTGAGGMSSVADVLKAKIDWRTALRDFLVQNLAGKDYGSWARPNRRYIGSNVYLPTTMSDTVPCMVSAVDTSGSISQKELSVAVSELALCLETVRPEVIHQVYWDTTVAGHEVYDADSLDAFIASTRPVGGGGTDVACVPPYLQAKSISPACVVVFTDGYLGGDWGQWTCPVLWVVINNGRCNAPVGVTIHVDAEDY